MKDLCSSCIGIAEKLGLGEAEAGGRIAQCIEQGVADDWAAALNSSEQAAELYGRIGHGYGRFMATRERMRALVGEAMTTGKLEIALFDQMNLELQEYALNKAPGLRPLVALELARFAQYVDTKLASDLASDAHEVGREKGHPTVPQKAQELLDEIG